MRNQRNQLALNGFSRLLLFAPHHNSSLGRLAPKNNMPWTTPHFRWRVFAFKLWNINWDIENYNRLKVAGLDLLPILALLTNDQRAKGRPFKMAQWARRIPGESFSGGASHNRHAWRVIRSTRGDVCLIVSSVCSGVLLDELDWSKLETGPH